jgi:hypothetical protein
MQHQYIVAQLALDPTEIIYAVQMEEYVANSSIGNVDATGL